MPERNGMPIGGASGDTLKVAFDVGGTFTDVVFIDKNGHVTPRKLLSVISKVGNDVCDLIDELGDERARSFVHATTTCSNALLENTVAKTGLLTTRGFRDVLEMRNQRRPDIHDVAWDRLRPLIPRALVREVPERMLASGQVEQELAEDEVIALLHGPLEDVDALAVCLINAYVNPEHEERVANLIAEHRPGVPVCVSTREFPDAGEYERMSTSCVNASLMPVVEQYLSRLEGQLDARGPQLLIMQSNGGLMDARIARRRPAQMIESGPAAGVLAAANLAKENGLSRVLAFDMGGTTAKASAVFDGRPIERMQAEIGGGANVATRFFGAAGHLVRVTSLDIVEVGAGGGSIAWVDGGGGLRVGPAGAGADPGPACYGRGGTSPTVTDANVVLGYMSSSALAGGSVPIDRNAAERAIVEHIAEPLGLDLVAAALGIVRVANATMMRALRAVSVEKGEHPQDFTIVAFGGAGPVHAAQLADDVGVATVYIPPFPGIFSAVGLLLAEYRHDAMTSFVAPLASLDFNRLWAARDALAGELSQLLETEGIALEDAELQAEVDLNYRGHDEPLTVPLAPGTDRERLHGQFVQAHQETFGHAKDIPVDMSRLRLRVTAATREARGLADLVGMSAPSAAESGAREDRRVHFAGHDGAFNVPVTTRQALADRTVSGPLLLDEPDTTVVIPPGWTGTLDANHNIILTKEQRSA